MVVREINLGYLGLLLNSHCLSLVRIGQAVRTTDFIRYYCAGQLAQSAAPRIYDWNLQQDFLAKIVPEAVSGKPYIQYTPPAFVLMIPFSHLPLEVAHVVWDGVSMLLSLGTLLLLTRCFPGLTKKDPLFLTIGLCAAIPTWWTIINGQLGFLILTGAGLYSFALLKDKPVLGGISLAVLSVKPNYLPFLVIPALVDRRWKLLLFGALAELLLLVAIAQITGWQCLIDYPKQLAYVENVTWVNAERMVCLRAAITALVPAEKAMAVSTLLMLIGTGRFVFVLYRWKKNHLPEQRKHFLCWAISLSIIFGLLFSPHVHMYDCLLMAIPAALTLPHFNISSAIAETRRHFQWWRLLLVFYPILSWVMFIGLPEDIRHFAFTAISLSLMVIALSIGGSVEKSPSDDDQNQTTK